MSDSDSESVSGSYESLDSDGAIKCASPPREKAKYIDKNIKLEKEVKLMSAIDPSDIADDTDDTDSTDDDDLDSNSTRSPSPKRHTVEFNRFEHYDKSDDEDDDYRTEIAHDQRITLKIQYCCWTINNFSTCTLNKEGYINSKIYSAGVMNELQWYFRVERFKQKKEVYYGVYVHIITHDDEDAEIEFRGYITELRGHSYRLADSKLFPKKEGFKLLGFLRKSHIRDDDYWYYRMIPDDDLTLSFRIHVQLKKFKNKVYDDFKNLWKNEKLSDFTLVVKGQKFPVHKIILAARSPVFQEMFENEGNLSEIVIEDIQPEAIEQLLRYIYTGRVKKLLKYLKEFSIVANRYHLTDLKAICEKALVSHD